MFTDTMSRFFTTCLALVVLCAVARPLQAQKATWANAGDENSQRLIVDRNRESMRLGELPLTVIGIEQADNQFRTNTPALLNHTGQIAMVDVGEAYARRLAMFDEGASFDKAESVREINFGTRGQGRTRVLDAPVKPPVSVDAMPEPEEEHSYGWLWLVPIALLLVLAKFLFSRNS